ncbi:proton-conducting transporter transmembrane domain-containing protein [Streptomyces sp. 8L]|uniref:proton-conducting transporter transmembrane domain-containing protein n=1 Tax=Streptomyces sp. 8L TaxID=2877242 RepID=UPI001CD34754|nr:proton-conducting transporter membrane subunit [Streptomyces sp. 8L]MCA1218068.1 hypothetical protein [Streptomyces sp. 8L]
MTTVVLVGLLLFAAGAAADALVRPARWRARTRQLPWLLCAGGSGCLAAVGAWALAHPRREPRLSLGTWLGFGHTALEIDHLTALFWLLTFSVGVAACLTAADWTTARPQGAGSASYCALVLCAVAVVESADNAFLLLLGWEALTLGFYLLTSAGHRHTNPAFITFTFSKISGAALLLGLLLAAARTGGGFALSDFSRLHAGVAHDTTWTLLVVAFAIKVGLVPVQIWMPRGYAAAPAGLRPVMAGVAVNAGFYGLWRTLDLLGGPPAWLALVLLLTASLTALLGIAHAAVQNRLERVIAYSSVENAGLICTGYALALVGTCLGSSRLTAAGLVAATLQTVAHAIAKSLLFAGAACLETDAGTGDLERLRGSSARRLPWAGTAVAVGSITLAGLPPTAGFVSEWFLLESLMQQFRLPHLPYALALAAAGALIALTAGFASVTFVRIVGMIVLGPRDQAPGERVRRHRDLGAAGRLGVLMLVLGGSAVAALTPLELRVISHGISGMVPLAATRGALKSPWVVQPVFADFSALSAGWLWVVMPALLLGVLVVLLLGGSRGRALHVRRTPAWRSASGEVAGESQYTPFGYANPTRRILGGILRTRTTLTPEGHDRDEGTAGSSAEQPRTAATGGVLGYSSDVVEVIERYLYRPLYRPLLALSAAAKRLQSGRLDAYLAYMLIALAALLAVVAGLA